MDVHIHGDGIKITETLERYTRAKVDKLDRYLPNIAHIGVELAIMRTHRGANLAIAQITVQHTRGAILRAEEKMDIENRDTIRLAINKAVDKLHRQIDRFKGKRRKGKHQRVRDKYKATLAELDMAEEVPEYEMPDAEDFAVPTDIFRRKRIELIPMHEQEAIEQLELLDHNFYMFMNADSGDVNVLYRRQNGGYGLLVPQ